MTRWHAASMIYKTEHHTLLINDNGHEHVSDNDNSCRVRATMSPIAKNMSVYCTTIRATLHMKTMSLNELRFINHDIYNNTYRFYCTIIY